MPSGLLQVFLFGLENLLFELGTLLVVIGNLLVVIGSHHGTLNLTLYSVHGFSVLILLTIAGVEALSWVNYYFMLLLFLTRIESVKKYLKNAGGYIGRNVVQITMKMRTIVRIMQIIPNLYFNY